MMKKKDSLGLPEFSSLISLLCAGNNNQNYRIMSTMRIKCLDMKEVESIIADAQEILSHVEFGSLQNGVLTLFCVL